MPVVTATTVKNVLVVPDCVETSSIATFLILDALLFTVIISSVRWWLTPAPDVVTATPPTTDGAANPSSNVVVIDMPGILPHVAATIGCWIGGIAMHGRRLEYVFQTQRRRPAIQRPF